MSGRATHAIAKLWVKDDDPSAKWAIQIANLWFYTVHDVHTTSGGALYLEREVPDGTGAITLLLELAPGEWQIMVKL